jgi:hypothetical protein
MCALTCLLIAYHRLYSQWDCVEQFYVRLEVCNRELRSSWHSPHPSTLKKCSFSSCLLMAKSVANEFCLMLRSFIWFSIIHLFLYNYSTITKTTSWKTQFTIKQIHKNNAQLVVKIEIILTTSIELFSSTHRDNERSRILSNNPWIILFIWSVVLNLTPKEFGSYIRYSSNTNLAIDIQCRREIKIRCNWLYFSVPVMQKWPDGFIAESNNSEPKSWFKSLKNR